MSLKIGASDHTDDITSILFRLGITPNLKGFDSIKQGISLIIADKSKYHQITKSLYPDIAKITGSTPGRVERSIRYAISVAIRADYEDEMQKIIGITPYKCRITNSEFMFTVAQVIEEERRNVGRRAVTKD